MLINTKSILLTTALLVTLALTWHSYRQETNAAVSLPTRVVSASSVRAPDRLPKTPAVDLTLTQRDLVDSTEDLFSSAYVPPVVVRQPQKSVPKAAAPVAPPLPFKYVGRWKDSQDQLVMLSVNDEVLSAKQGDVLLNQYVVQTIAELPQGLQMTFLYRPLNQTQQLFVGKAHDE